MPEEARLLIGEHGYGLYTVSHMLPKRINISGPWKTAGHADDGDFETIVVIWHCHVIHHIPLAVFSGMLPALVQLFESIPARLELLHGRILLLMGGLFAL